MENWMNTVIARCAACGTQNRIPEKKQHLGPRCGKCGGMMDMRQSAVPVQLGDEDLQDFLAACRLPVMVDFYSPGCGPCQMLAPVIDNIARKFAGEVVIAKLDTSRHGRSASHYGIRGVPTLIFFRDNKIVDQVVGAPAESLIIAKIKNLSGGNPS